MVDNYRVPALEKADAVLKTVAAEPRKLRLIELSRRLDIHKSSMFSLLHTMERLGWVRRERDDTYELGEGLALLGSASRRQNRLIDRFHQEGAKTMRLLGETLQLARLEGADAFYLGKEEAPTPVRLASEPGMRFPAHQTALGKAMLAGLEDSEVMALYPDPRLPAATPYSLTRLDQLLAQLNRVREEGIALDEQESVFGFCCIAAPIRGEDGRVQAAVSCSMPLHEWPKKRERTAIEIKRLAEALSSSPPAKGDETNP